MRTSVCILLTVLVLPAPISSGEHTRAIWVWEEETFRMLDDQAWRERVLDRLSEEGFNTLYLYADAWRDRSPIVHEPELYARLLSSAHGKGFRVEALLGSKYLGTNRYVLPDKRADARAMLRRVLDYNATHPGDKSFDAIHLDIEPYALPEWKSGRDEVIRHFATAAREWRQLVLEAEPDLEVGAAIPFWFDRVEAGERSLAERLIDAFDYVALMDYRDRAEGKDGIIAHARDEIAEAERRGRTVIVGVETDESDLDKTTFAEEGKAAMEVELEKVGSVFSGDAGFGGIAVHHLESYLGMKR